MQWLLIGYMFLFIDRPFEVWPILGDIHLERIYFLGMIGYWLIFANKTLPLSRVHSALLAFASALLISWSLSRWPGSGQPIVENWLKILAFYALIVTSVRDVQGLRFLVWGFVGSVFLYEVHSLREYLGGRHTYRMGIVRMLGVDDTQGDPNSFGATVLFALPFAILLYQTTTHRLAKFYYVGFSLLTFTCIGLTGSRSSFLGLSIWLMIEVFRSRHRWLALSACIMLAPVGFQLLPESLQTRFETIISPEVGPESARESSEGRLIGLSQGVDLFLDNPFSGCGPGAWRPATHSLIESHNLYGQVIGELGALGALAFLILLLIYFLEIRKIRSAAAWEISDRLSFPKKLAEAVGLSLFLLLLEGNFGHNLYRYNWLWYATFLVIARRCSMVSNVASEFDTGQIPLAENESEIESILE